MAVTSVLDMDQFTNISKEDGHVDYFNHHLQNEHSSNSDSTLEGDDTHNHNINSSNSDHETFNSQLKRRLSKLTNHKKQQQQQQHEQQTTPKKNYKKHDISCLKKDENSQSSCDCLIDEQDDQVNEIVSPIIIRSSTTHLPNIDSNVLSPNSLSTTSSLIFERNVQDQITNCCNCTTTTVTSTSTNRSRRNSHNLLARSQSFSSQSSIPNHLNFEFFIPQVLDATTEVLTDPNYNENVEVIQSSNNSNLSSSLLADSNNPQSSTRPGLGSRRMSRSVPISRRQSSCAPLSPISTTTTTTNLNDVDYSDKKKLNFCSFADLLSDETSSSDVLISPTSPKNNSTLGMTSNSTFQDLRDPFNKDHVFTQPPPPLQAQSNPPFPSLSKTTSIKEILLENQSELGK